MSESHFSRRIWQEILSHHKGVPERPFKCYACDYTNGSSLQLIIHVGVVHKMAIKYHFEVLNINKDWTHIESFGVPKKVPSSPLQSSPMVVKKETIKTVQPSKVAPPVVPKLEKCPVCEEAVTFPAVLFHVAQHHFSQLLATAKVPVEAPFKCPKCPHFAENYGAMLKHFLIFHKQLEVMTEKLKNPDASEVKVIFLLLANVLNTEVQMNVSFFSCNVYSLMQFFLCSKIILSFFFVHHLLCVSKSSKFRIHIFLFKILWLLKIKTNIAI